MLCNTMHKMKIKHKASEEIGQLPLFENSVNHNKGSFIELCESLGISNKPNFANGFGQGLHSWAEATIERPIRTLSLFSGAGGLDIAFHDAGFKIKAMVEIDERFAETLKANCGHNEYFEEAEVLCIDVHDYCPPQGAKIDFIIGGPPCQSFSAAGRRAAGVQGTKDERGNLFEEYVRILKHIGPKGFLFENVYGITGAEGGKAWQKIRDAFMKAGYAVSCRILDAADYGVPQHRERMFIVGMLGRTFKFPCPTHGPDSPDVLPHITAAEAIKCAAISKEERKAKVGGRFGHLLQEVPPGLNYSFFTENMGHPKPIFSWRSKFSDFLYKADPDTPVRTLKAQGGQYTGPFHWRNRPFSIGELKRLQSFPDNYKILGGKQSAIHQIGNSVPPQLGRILALAILNQLFDVELPTKLPYMEPGETLGFRKRKRKLTAVYKEKSRAALANVDKRPVNTYPLSRKYRAILTDDFELINNSSGNNALEIGFARKKEAWELRVRPVFSCPGPSFAVDIKPVPGRNWAIGVSQVRLCGANLNRDVFTGAWKAFEAELIRFHIKADLVQLNGYYQYSPNFRCSVLFDKEEIPSEWRSLAKIIEGVGTGNFVSLKEAGKLWEIAEDRVMEFALWLRSLGYEVRNRKTNPQIPRDHLLVPYAFPTFNSMSVQLRKSLI